MSWRWAPPISSALIRKAIRIRSRTPATAGELIQRPPCCRSSTRAFEAGDKRLISANVLSDSTQGKLLFGDKFRMWRKVVAPETAPPLGRQRSQVKQGPLPVNHRDASIVRDGMQTKRIGTRRIRPELADHF